MSDRSDLPASFHVYILRCSDGSYYVGHAVDLPARVAVHNTGKGAAWTARRRPVVLIYQEPFATEPEAVARKLQLKGWSRAKKEALVSGDFTRLKQVSKAFGSKKPPHFAKETPCVNR